MPIVIYAPRKDGHHDGSLAKQTQHFIRKLFENDALPGLHIEPIHNSVDPKVRTGRVSQMYRAVLFKLQASGGPVHYVFTGVWPHDEAIEIASKAVLKTNPVNGLPELIMAAEVPLPPSAPSSPPAREAPVLNATGAKLTLEQLTDKLGIDPQVATRALAATSEDKLMALAESAVEWQGLALLDLAAGRTVDDVRKTLGLDTPPAVDDTAGEDEKLLAGLETPTAKMQFAWLRDDAELQAVIEGGDFARWRTFLHPDQRRYAEASYSGSFRLSGGAGTGKTVVLLHRARMLAKRDPSARIVLTTFTRNLAEALARDLRLLEPSIELATALGEPGVFVTGVDAAAGRVLSSAPAETLEAASETVLGVGGNRAATRVSDDQRQWRDAISAVGASLPAELRSSTFMAAEYATVVLPTQTTTRDGYIRVRRPGRRVALGRRQRGAVWDVISAYRAAGAVSGAVDFGEACAISAEVNRASDAFLADHVLVDEGQDLSASQWRFLRSLVDTGRDDLFIAEDSQQRIYGQRVVLSRCGISIVGRSRRLTLNYRTTAQVLGFATSVLAGAEYVDLDETATDPSGYRSARGGPVPELVAATSLSEQLERAVTRVRSWLDGGVTPETIGLLARDQRTVDVVARGFEDRGLTIRHVTRSVSASKHPQLMTMHRAKGMEFSRVLIFAANADLVPAAYVLKDTPEDERADVLQRERSLFYVAATRARDELVVMWEGEQSEFLSTPDVST